MRLAAAAAASLSSLLPRASAITTQSTPPLTSRKRFAYTVRTSRAKDDDDDDVEVVAEKGKAEAISVWPPPPPPAEPSPELADPLTDTSRVDATKRERVRYSGLP